MTKEIEIAKIEAAVKIVCHTTYTMTTQYTYTAPLSKELTEAATKYLLSKFKEKE